MTNDNRGMVIFGGRSYTAAEMLRLLVGHPKLSLAGLVSRSATGAMLSELHPHVAGLIPDLAAIDDDAAYAQLAGDESLVIALCLGADESAAAVKELASRGLLENRVLVDLSGGFRLKDPAEYQRWYDDQHVSPEWLARFDYCIPELHRAECSSTLVANPGCFASAVQLALAPAVRSGLITKDLHVFGATGSSGSGATPKSNTHHPTRANEVYAYKPLMHQHTPEIHHGLGLSEDTRLSFITHSVPIVRGITVTASLILKSAADGLALTAAYRDLCANEPMLAFLESGTPRFAGITGTNIARLAVSVQGDQAVAFCAIDNLCRGASGQAIQNLNRVLGWPETLGLQAAGLFPA